ncbi:hypothetical protein [Mucilaginibacter paludis]|uniref:Uncharacterized protein n=1 Tax=Mucilaginibacter paludis DSM 18603 TaxID=714943 RepID=H1YJ11_9SPHI|nr:hypothetical protein [Mucilaginibacter paludis]EHQ27706.1 hypothetical protein Mucpa_3608 [Mucilaginibacter paludis DSM 18603]
MATLTTQHAQWTTQEGKKEQESNLWNKWLAFADSQASKKTMWFMVALMGQGVLFLPIPALLMYYFDAPIYVLAITLGLFFANFIAGMGGSNIRTTLSLFALSIITHLIMLLVFIL